MPCRRVRPSYRLYDPHQDHRLSRRVGLDDFDCVIPTFPPVAFDPEKSELEGGLLISVDGYVDVFKSEPDSDFLGRFLADI